MQSTFEGQPNAATVCTVADLVHERNVVIDVVHAVCQVWGLEVLDVTFPEDEKPRPRRPLDGVVFTTGPTIAIEHTLHQSFAKQREQAGWFGPVLAMADRISGTLPGPGTYTLSVRSTVLRGHHKTDLTMLESWIRVTAPTLTPGRRFGPTNVAHGVPPAVPFPVSLLRTEHFDGVPEGRLDVRWPFDLEELPTKSREQMVTSLRAKLPKLDEHRPKGGVTLLILENQDIQLVNPDNVYEAVRAALTDASELVVPDAIVVANIIGGEQGLSWVKDGDRWHPELNRYWTAAPRIPSG